LIRLSSCAVSLWQRQPVVAGLLGALATSSLAWLPLQPAHANMVRHIITGKCSEAMRADFNKAAKNPPAGMVEFTCGCVADGMLQRRQSLDQAKTVCVHQATKKYGHI
jgi:hypothetical protein